MKLGCDKQELLHLLARFTFEIAASLGVHPSKLSK